MPAFVYNANSSQREINFEKGTFHYLTIVMSNCLYNGSAFDASVQNLEALLQIEFEKISNLELRGVGCSMVRGDTDSLTLGVSAGYYTASVKANLTQTEALSLRVASNSAIAAVANFTCSELRVETTLIQESTF